MIKKILISLIFSIFLIANSFAAGSSDSGSSKTKTQYDMAVTHIKAAKNFEKKDKLQILAACFLPLTSKNTLVSFFEN